MEQMTQELSIDNHNLKTIKKLYNDCTNSNTFLNTYTMIDVESGKKQVFSSLMKKYNYKNPDYIQDFVEKSSLLLAQELFSSSSLLSQSQPCVSTDLVVPSKEMSVSRHENHRIINIDSCYRENLLSQNQTYDSYTSSDMIIDLNDTLDNIISLELANICIPFTFYNISEDQGNNYFYVYTVSTDSSTKISIDGGNYTNDSIISSINEVLVENSIDISFEIDALSNKVSISTTTTDGYEIIFYDNNKTSDYSFADNCISSSGGANVQSKANHNLGWSLGFRNIDVENYDKISYTIDDNTSVTAEALCYLPYTKYFIIVIDDKNKNQSNKSLVQISNGKLHMNSTKYFKDIDNSLNCLTDDNFDSYVNDSGRTLTKNQLYSSLQVNNYRASFNETNSKLSADLINNVFAIVPFETKSLVWGSSMFTSDKNKFKRKYNGPVDVSKLNIKLLDDRGNLLNLNGADWSFSMISTHSYKK